MSIERSLTGARLPGKLTIVVEGGEVDCIVHRVSPSPRIDLGGTYVLFLRPSVGADAKPREDYPLAFEAFPVDKDGTVTTAEDGVISVEELAAAIAPPGQGGQL